MFRREQDRGTTRADCAGLMLVRTSLRPFLSVADAIGVMFRRHVEVVIHDLLTEQIVHVVNCFSKRGHGDPSMLHLVVDLNEEAEVIGPYDNTNWDGRRIRSVSVVLRDADGEAVGLMCLNFDLSQFETSARVLLDFLGVKANGDESATPFRDDWYERINQFVSNWVEKQETALDRLTRVEKRDLIGELRRSGAFEGRSAVVYIARILSISRATIYKHIKELKESERKE